jgi:hypothetical protein
MAAARFFLAPGKVARSPFDNLPVTRSVRMEIN